jgi:thioredoxin 1
MMKKTVACGVLVLVATIISARRYADSGCCSASSAAAGVIAATPSPAETARPTIPRLVDLGRTFCIPCKKMAPILAGLKVEYAGRLDVEFIDVGENPDAARKYGIRLIPTQVFIDASGKELSRHEGFMAREDILAQWKKLGVDFGGAAITP